MTKGKARDPKNRSEKDCCCGGHNHKNVKKNLNHHGTKNRYLIRLSRKEKQYGPFV